MSRNVIDNFETAFRRYHKHKIKDVKSYIVAFSFGRGPREEVARAKKEGIDITLITGQDILDKKVSVLPSSQANVPPNEDRRRKCGTTVSQKHLFGK